jgi:hypothetical protein
MVASHVSFRRWLLAAGCTLLVVASVGCIGVGSQLLYMLKGGDRLPAEFDGLQDKRVAVVCVSNASSSGPHAVSGTLERSVALLLTQKGKNIRLVRPDEVANWIDTNDWNQLDYREIGRGVNADMVLAIDLESFSLHEGSTLYRGRASVTVTVYDMREGGKVAFRRSIPEYSFPANGARHSTEMSEARFRSLFIQILAQQIARYFYSYQIQDDFAKDALLLNG